MRRIVLKDNSRRIVLVVALKDDKMVGEYD
jgi:hypothetical protein